MRVVPGLIKDGEVQVFIEVQDERDTLEIAGLDKDEEVDADDEVASAESEPGSDDEGQGMEEDEDEGDEEDEDEDEDEAPSRLDVVADAIAVVCETLYQRLQAKLDEDEAPSEFKIEFGVALAGNMGIPVVSHGDSAAAFKVTVKWDNG